MSDTLRSLLALSATLRKNHMPHGANVAIEGANELRKCHVGRKTLADNYNALSEAHVNLKVKYGRLLQSHITMGKDVNAFVKAARKLGMCREQA